MNCTLSRLFLILFPVCTLALGNNQTIEIVNSSNLPLTIEHNIPENSKASVELKNINSLQYKLYKAIQIDSPAEIREAINAGANIHQPRVGKSPLLTAILSRSTNAVETLLAYGATDNYLNEFDATLEEYAIKLGDFKSAFFLLRNMCDLKIDRYVGYARSRFYRFLQGAFAQHKPNAILYLLKESTGFFGKNEWVINKSTGKREWILEDVVNIESILLLLHNISVDKQQNPDMSIFLEITQEIIDHGYDVNSIWTDKGEKGNIQHLLYRHPEILGLFLENGADPNYEIKILHYPNTTSLTYPIFQATLEGNTSAVELLLRYGAFVNQRNSSHKNCGKGCSEKATPLSIATNHGQVDIVDLLLKYNALL